MRRTTASRRRALYDDAVALIEREYASELDLDSVALRVASSRRQLQRVFAEIGHTTFRRRLADVRMRNAVDLLEDGSLPVREVARRVGYRQPAQFAKAFRRHHGTPPSSLRASGPPATDGNPGRFVSS
jgi:AraC family transcriptional regulator, regulatory protein of adaptative response / methylphosphotriester-DNA alkyltransferase methyltransferase